MSLPEPAAPRKSSPLIIYVAFGLTLLLVAGWSGAWVWARGQLAARLDAGADGLRRAGYEVSWSARSLGGYPFRLDVTLTDAVIRDRSGWALQTPRLEGEAPLYAPTHWVVAAPEGLTFVRPVGGPVRVTGKLVRASVTHLANTPPNISFEGVDLAFQPAAGAQPFALSSAQRIEVHLRRAPAEIGDEAGVWVSIKDAKARLTGLIGRIAGDKPVSFEWDSRLSHASALKGRSWADLIRNWTAAGGRMNVKQAGLTAGDALAGANTGTLTVDSDGRINGALELSLREAPRALGVMGATGAVPEAQAAAATAVVEARSAGADAVRATLAFQAGRTTLGPVALAPAPRVYEPGR